MPPSPFIFTKSETRAAASAAAIKQHPLAFFQKQLRAESALELPAHTLFRSRTEVGDQLVIDRYEAKTIPKSKGGVATSEFPPRVQPDRELVASTDK
jgi:hypothetical protein